MMPKGQEGLVEDGQKSQCCPQIESKGLTGSLSSVDSVMVSVTGLEK